MRYSIVTPTIVRPSLVTLCASIDAQTEKDWEHILLVDMPEECLNEEKRTRLDSLREHSQRHISFCATPHCDYGHSCRHAAWERCNGEFIFYVDDDDYLYNTLTLSKLNVVTADWAIFPVLRHGQRFFNDPPGIARTGTGMFMHRKSIGRWPLMKDYEADGYFVCELMDKGYKYDNVHSGDPLVVQPKSSYGEG